MAVEIVMVWPVSVVRTIPCSFGVDCVGNSLALRSVSETLHTQAVGTAFMVSTRLVGLVWWSVC